jgi:hypothetical protein
MDLQKRAQEASPISFQKSATAKQSIPKERLFLWLTVLNPTR